MDGLRLTQGMPMAAPVMDARARCTLRPKAQVGASGPRAGAAGGGGAVESASPGPDRLSYMFPRPLRRLWPLGAGAERPEEEAAEEGEKEVGEEGQRRRRGDSWVLKILRVTSLWAEEEKDADRTVAERADEGDRCVTCGACEEGEEGCVVGEGEEEGVGGGMVFDRDSFSMLLRRVTLADAQLYRHMSYLGSLAYTIPNIKPENLLECHGLRLITSSLERKARLKAENKQEEQKQNEQKAAQDLEQEEETGKEEDEGERNRKDVGISLSTAYQIAASAALYLHSQTRDILPFKSSKPKSEKDSPVMESIEDSMAKIGSSEVADFVATTNSVTAVVAGKEEMKQAVAKDLNSTQNSPCEWFICDDDRSGTRYFVIQGSETLASWQANLLFEPIQFEGLDVLVHRGIYEAAKGMYEQMLPEIRAHLKCRGHSATLRFTGHSLGGSLSLLVNLMLLIRGEAPRSSLLPVITFGAPTIMCGGDYLLCKLGLPQSHVQAIMMHRDIVPRAFSCNYPDHVAKILKAINGNFRNHPCLLIQKLLYAPMGKLLILQPEEKFSPHHHLLPPGSGLYLLGHLSPESSDSVRLLEAAQSAFLNSPHPLEILSDHGAYGSEGTVYRDHDMKAYLRSLQDVIRHELRQIRKAKREQRREAWWPLVAVQGIHIGVVTSQLNGLGHPTSNHHFSFSGVLQGGKETLKLFGKLVASQRLHVPVVLLFAARLLLLGTLAVVKFSSI